MFLQLLTALLALHCTIPTISASERSLTKALQFGSTLDDYIQFSPDMSQVKDSLTVCSWVKKQLTGTYRTWFSYKTSTHSYEILISDAGIYNWIHNIFNILRRAVTVPLNTWTHQCHSWSASTGTMKTYYNGTLIGSKSVWTSVPIEEGGVITLGHDAASPHNHEIFGGQLMKLDIFGKVLSSKEIAELYNAGRCSDVEKKHQEVRFIT
ncbi:pentraxin-related protein PTX3-like [Bolinopsis microptera]|uniref:pentraxin-related protein PTX3-like n=1 Tax=Bolinopsis microptera TaxID=2820187 RepID=UPI003079F40D